MPHFVKIGQSVAKILQFFDFSRWRPMPCWNVKFTKFYWLRVSGGPRCIIIPNFVKISHSVAEILRFSNFENGGRRHLGFPTRSCWNAVVWRRARFAACCASSHSSSWLVLDTKISKDPYQSTSYKGEARKNTKNICNVVQQAGCGLLHRRRLGGVGLLQCDRQISAGRRTKL